MSRKVTDYPLTESDFPEVTIDVRLDEKSIKSWITETALQHKIAPVLWWQTRSYHQYTVILPLTQLYLLHRVRMLRVRATAWQAGWAYRLFNVTVFPSIYFYDITGEVKGKIFGCGFNYRELEEEYFKALKKCKNPNIFNEQFVCRALEET